MKRSLEASEINSDYSLADRFERDGRVYLTGWDALVRLPMLQRRVDQLNGLNTAGFVSGYPGSPFGGLDSLFRAQRSMLADQNIHFEPAVNEDLAATSVWGTQSLNVGPVSTRYDGVFGLWYGKGPGLERSTDAIRTGNYQGVSRNGGVLALVGDDHEARSTVTAQQSETLFMHMLMPVLYPSTIQEFLDLGLAGWALSRFSSCWIGVICLNDIVDSAATVDVPAQKYFSLPEDLPSAPAIGAAGGVANAAALEGDIRCLRHPAAQAFVRANQLDAVTVPSSRPKIGIISAGKAYLDVMDALHRIGLSSERASQLGISVYKLAMTWPLDPIGVREFLDGLTEVLVVEAKHPVIEDQVARLVRSMPRSRRPDLVGKTDHRGAPLIPEIGGLTASIVADALLARIEHVTGDADLIASMTPRGSSRLISPDPRGSATELVRAPGFCSGCPHNTSTRLPDGSYAMGGTGCHGMAISLDSPGRQTTFFTHMGGEGALWIGMAPFAEQSHIFQNIGDGTYFHSGSLALRAAIAAGVTMTFKVLLNGYISMTGGQAIPGGLSAQEIAAQAIAEGASKVVVVSDDTSTYRGGPPFPLGVDVAQREQLIAIEQELAKVAGVTVLVYDQACAAELRRERKRGVAPDPDKRVFIHDVVCEGCGDCNVQSNCISVEPLDTDLGRKRTIDQSSCNKDFSCVTGYCPSFVTLYGAKPRATVSSPNTSAPLQHFDSLPEPVIASTERPYNIVLGGIGGAGVLTLGSVLGVAAYLEGKAVSVLNESGLAQKNGAVQSHVRIAADPTVHLTPRVADASADLIIGADIVVAASPTVTSLIDVHRTRAVVNTAVRPTVAFVHSPEMNLSSSPMTELIDQMTGAEVDYVNASRIVTKVMGDSIYTNMFLLGYSAQKGLLPVSIGALEKAISVNSVSVASNHAALAYGRLAAHDLSLLPHREPEDIVTEPSEMGPIEALIRRRESFLVQYQNRAYAERYGKAVRRVGQAERNAVPGSDELTCAAAEGMFNLMAYKDEYEVARLYTDPSFRRRLEETFEGNFRYKVNLAPQILNRRDRSTNRAKKWEVPSEIARPIFRVLASLKWLRGTPFDLFGRTPHRRAERERIIEYEQLLSEIVAGLNSENHEIAIRLAACARTIRGYDMIKDASAAEAKQKERVLLAEFRDRVSARAAGRAESADTSI